MPNRNTNTPQTGAGPKVDVLAPETAEESAAKPKVKTVTGRRLVDRAEQFVIVDDSPEAAPEPTEAEDASAGCDFCGIVFSDEKWAENGGYCPNCNRDENGDPPPEERELSEAEILLQSIENDGEYSLHVERLVNYEKDGRTDTRSEKTFCTKIKPVTLDYLDIVRREFGSGAYRFSMYRKGVGLVKNGIWVDVIEKPIAVPAPPVVAAQSTSAVPAEKEDPILAITTAANKLSALKRALGGDEIEQLREELKQQNAANRSNAAAPDNQYALLNAVMASGNQSLTEKLVDRIVPEETKSTWVGDLLAHPQEAMTLVGLFLDRLERLFRPQSQNGNAAANGNNQLPPPPSLNQMLPPPVIAVLDVIGEDILNYEPGEDADLSESVWRAADAIADATDPSASNAQVKQSLTDLLAMSPVEICHLLSGQAGLPIQGIEHLRIVGYEYIARKKDADVFFRELKLAVKQQQEARASADAQHGVGTAGVSPVPATETLNV